MKIEKNNFVFVLKASRRPAFSSDVARTLRRTGDSLLESGSIMVTDILKESADNNWGKGKPKNAPKSIGDMMKTTKGFKELNKMTKKGLLKKASNEFWKESLWGLGKEFISGMSKNELEKDYSERQQQNSYPSPYQYPTSYNQNMNYLHVKNMLKSKNRQYEMLIQALSLKR